MAPEPLILVVEQQPIEGANNKNDEYAPQPAFISVAQTAKDPVGASINTLQATHRPKSQSALSSVTPKSSPIMKSMTSPALQLSMIDQDAVFDCYALDEHILSRGLSLLGQAASSQYGLVYRKLSLPGIEIKDISFIRKFPCLEVLDLACNHITDAKTLKYLPYLYSINLSNNKLVRFDTLVPPINLQDLDLSRNQIMSVSDLGNHKYLRNVCLDRNLIKNLAGFGNCKFLTHLSISYNAVTNLSGIENLPIRYLDLRWNRIRSIAGTAQLPDLECLLLSHNEIGELPNQLSTKCSKLETLHLDHNTLSSKNDVLYLHAFTGLRELRLQSNLLVSSIKPYRQQVIFHLPQIFILDGLRIDVTERVSSINLFDPPFHVVEATKHASALIREASLYAPMLTPEWNDVNLESRSVLQTNNGSHDNGDHDQQTSDTETPDYLYQHSLYFSSKGLGGTPCPYLPLIVCGQAGVGKRTLIGLLLNEFPHIFGQVISHTTRKPRARERHGVDYYFVDRDEMEHLAQTQKMASVISQFGHLYGTSIESCERIKNEGRIGIVAMEIEGALALYGSGFAARYIFIAPPSLNELDARLQSRQLDQSKSKNRKNRNAHLLNYSTLQHTDKKNPPDFINSPVSEISRFTLSRKSEHDLLNLPSQAQKSNLENSINRPGLGGLVSGQSRKDELGELINTKSMLYSSTNLFLSKECLISDKLTSPCSNHQVPNMLDWTFKCLATLTASKSTRQGLACVLRAPDFYPPKPFECVVVNDQLEHSYMALRQIALSEFNTSYQNQINNERIYMETL